MNGLLNSICYCVLFAGVVVAWLAWQFLSHCQVFSGLTGPLY